MIVAFFAYLLCAVHYMWSSITRYILTRIADRTLLNTQRYACLTADWAHGRTHLIHRQHDYLCVDSFLLPCSLDLVATCVITQGYSMTACKVMTRQRLHHVTKFTMLCSAADQARRMVCLQPLFTLLCACLSLLEQAWGFSFHGSVAHEGMLFFTGHLADYC